METDNQNKKDKTSKFNRLDTRHNLFSTVSDFLDCLVVILDPGGRITYYNNCCEEITGRALSDAENNYYWDLFCRPEEKELYKAFFAMLEPDQFPFEVEAQLPGVNNLNYLVSWKYNALLKADGTLDYHVLTGIDITTYKKANENLQEIGEKYRTLIHVSPVSVITLDPFLKVRSWSSAAENLLGWTEKSAIEKEIVSIINDQDGILVENCKKAISGEIVNNLELSCKRKNGSSVDISFFLAPLREQSGMVEGIVLIALNITDRKNAEKSLRSSEKKYREILESMEEGYYESDLQGHIIATNKAASRMLGYEEGELIGKSYKAICKDFKSVYSEFHNSFKTGEPRFSVIVEMLRKNSSICVAELSLSLTRDHEENIIGFRGLGRDITERIKTEEKLRYISFHDTLTGVYNRTYFENEIERLEGSRNYPVAIILADIDHLKLVNDSLGHKDGDLYLKTCADLLKKNLRNSDLLARLGGDEFALILPHTDQKAGQCMITRIRRCADLYNSDNPDLPVSVSMGIAVSINSSQPLEETFRAADSLMYKDKLNRGLLSKADLVKAIISMLAKRKESSPSDFKRKKEICEKLGQEIGLSKNRISELFSAPFKEN